MRDYFRGWYAKCQSEEQTLAVIPAFHKTKGRQTASLQLITDKASFHVPLGGRAFYTNPQEFCVWMDRNSFGRRGMKLDIRQDGCRAEGELRFGPFSELRYDIMGPFRYVPFMECRHQIVSMRHQVSGEILVNGTAFSFDKADGYIEGDRGASFPRAYAWTQSFFDEGSLMLSVAEIPMGVLRFTGVICVIFWRGREIRLATYLGARPVKIGDGEIIIAQGDMVFSAKLCEERAHLLRAPVKGAMGRFIRESPRCRAAYCLEKGGRTLFSFETERASFEYEYDR